MGDATAAGEGKRKRIVAVPTGTAADKQNFISLFSAKSEIAEKKPKCDVFFVFSVDHHSGLASVLPVCPSPIQIMHLATRSASHRPFWVLFVEWIEGRIKTVASAARAICFSIPDPRCS